eukprot:CAMPEP_0204820982 /NCGR_PEP_ID=MMETSP1018-20131115/909_1 /ASSEMBLY_ACC=CAM_ASM_000518 /TAXON_ID=46462 /ORGANISM="Anophryoides haemophila, Strain AH6" /LENGTH=36 /DNA_ID= /DNA_START= /DNA_END= /DNA_ORIENTATION=
MDIDEEEDILENEEILVSIDPDYGEETSDDEEEEEN